MKLDRYEVMTPGTCTAEAVICSKPLSFWGGVDTTTGRIIDVHHPECGTCISQKVLALPYDRGSCSGSGVMLEMLRLGTAPAGILCVEAEPVLALAPMIGEQLYGRGMPIRTVTETDFQKIPGGRCGISFTEEAIIIDED